MKDKSWYLLNHQQVLEELNTEISGLSSQEAEKRLEKYGKNCLPKKKQETVFQIFFKEMLDPIVLLLFVTVLFSWFIGEYIDAFAILFIILMDLILGTVQEFQAEKNALSLQNLIHDQVQVVRDGKVMTIDATFLVPGDIVLLSSGEKIAADMRILESNNLQVNESVLTGESLNVIKTSEMQTEEKSPSHKNMVYAGCTVTTGRGKCVVIHTGLTTEVGHIAKEVTSLKKEKSPLTIRMEKFSKQITKLLIVIALFLAIVLLIKGYPSNEIFLSVIALTVSAMPEGLPLALTMALTIASNKMAKKNVIVKKLNAVESLGSCTVIATDKTGTLTVNEQTAKLIVLPSGERFPVEGVGYYKKGKILVDKNHEKEVQRLAYLGYINNDAYLEEENKKEKYVGDSIDIAFLVLGKKAMVDSKKTNVIARIPYESENQYSALFYQEKKTVRCTVKGSTEQILKFVKLTKKEKEQLQLLNESLAKEGYRVIALADGEIPNFEKKESYHRRDIKNLTFIGFVSFIDPVREDAKDSIQVAQNAGIQVVMITGDHPLTAFQIGKELKLVETEEEITTGIELEEVLKKGEDAFDSFIARKKIFARVSPMDKLHIVEAFKRRGEFVAVTGDGVNDAPAIQSANIGIAMGSGTDVSRETATMILRDDNFTSIVAGIEEGRCAYSNIRKVSYFLLSCGFAEVLFFLLSILLDLPMPLVAIQLLFLNLVTDGLQDLALSFEKIEPSTMKEKPRNPKENLFNREFLQEVLISGLAIGSVVFIVWFYLIKKLSMDVLQARGYIMVLMVFMQNIHVLNCRSEKKSVWEVPLRKNPFVLFTIGSAIIIQIIVMEVPFLSQILQTSTVPISDMIVLFILSTFILILMEIYKKVVY